MSFEAQWLSARLNYEILNISIESIAKSMNLRIVDIQAEADENNWNQWFPEDESEFDLDPGSELNEGENLFEIKANQFTDTGKKRLEVYQVAKQLMLMSLYTKLEVNLISKANEAAELLDVNNINDIATLSGVLNSLTKDLSKLAQSMTLGQDDKGLPQLIIRDLSGAGKD
jgi:hypothetical protein